jgi:molybdopterin/thiamine biosynthesis adenylyltransferase/rhodanese-related sulfurtransferase
MLSPQEEIRYSRQLLLPEIGRAGQEKLANAKVLVIGAGGLGCPVLQYLAAAGVGAIGIVDGDTVEESNLQRQILYTNNDIGRGKAVTAQEKIQAANPHIHVQAHSFAVTPANILELIAPYDIVVDGTDNFAARYLINDACVLLNKPWVFGSIFRFEGQVSVFNHAGGPTYRCIFPLPPGEEESPACSVIGVLSSLPGIVGSLQATETIKLITGAGEPLSGRLLVIDALSMNMQVLQVSAVESGRNIQALQSSYEDACETEATLISYTDLQQLKAEEIVLIDVREPSEHHLFNIGGVNIPLAQLETEYAGFGNNKNIIVYCASGIRSSRAATLLTKKGARVSSLRDGINGIDSRLLPQKKQ